MPKTTFTATVQKHPTMNAAGITVPPAEIAKLGTSKRPKVKVTLNGYTYRSTVAVMGGEFMIGVAQEHRAAAGLKGGEKLKVTLELDTEERTVDVPADLKKALTKAKVLKAFEAQSFTNRKEAVRSVEEAKAPETRLRRIDKIVSSLQA
jgi:hypothetical protein